MPSSENSANPELRHQFVVSKKPAGTFRHNFEMGGWSVEHGDGFAQTRILDEQRELIGAFFGAVVDLESNSFMPSSITVPWRAGMDRKVLEDSLYERAGTWIAIIVTPELHSLYLDACGSLPVVYSRDRKVAGSSACVLLHGKEYFDDLYDEAKSEAWFRLDRYHTAGLTAHRSLLRLLPNHRLDLADWNIGRIWPSGPLPSLTIDQVTTEVAEVSRNTIRVAMHGRPALMPLTAGNETRALLSLARGQESELTFFTGSFPGAIVDLGVARRLSKRFGLPHVITSVRARSESELRAWRLSTGHCVGGAICYSKMDRQKIAHGEVEFSGAAGEVGRGFFWSANDKLGDRLTGEVLLARLKLPLLDRFITSVNEWLDSVKQFDVFTVMDLAYIELKMACWAGPQAPGTETDTVQIWPFSSRRCFGAMMSAPPQVRLEQSIFRRIVQQEWPELLEVPINKGTAWENAQKLLYRASSPQRVWNRIRKSLAKMKPAKETA